MIPPRQFPPAPARVPTPPPVVGPHPGDRLVGIVGAIWVPLALLLGISPLLPDLMDEVRTDAFGWVGLVALGIFSIPVLFLSALYVSLARGRRQAMVLALVVAVPCLVAFLSYALALGVRRLHLGDPRFLFLYQWVLLIWCGGRLAGRFGPPPP